MGLHDFIERMLERTREVRTLLLPELERYCPERPWSAAALRALAAEIERLDPALRRALDHALVYELPLLVFEAGHEGLPDSEFIEKMHDFEMEHWRRLYRPAGGEETGPSFLCVRHRLREDAVREVVAGRDIYRFETAAPLVGADPRCPECRTAVMRIMVEELKRAKAEGRMI